MKKCNLGITGIEVSEIAFGTAALGLPYGFGCEGTSIIPKEKSSIELLNMALDSNVNFFDTALTYGPSEEILGKAFKNRRDEAVICTKPNHLCDTFKGQALPSDTEIKKSLENSFTQSLSRLQTDYIDIYMFHNGTEEVIGNDTVIDFFQRKKQEGVIRATGVSVYTLEQSLAAINRGVWDVIQLQFNLMDQRQLPAIELAKEKSVGIVIRSVVFRGILTDRGSNLHPELKSVQQHREKYFDLIQGGISGLSDLATKFALSCDGVSSVLVGIDKPEYLEQALKAVNGKYLDKKTLENAKRLAYPEPEFLSLRLWDRNGWLK